MATDVDIPNPKTAVAAESDHERLFRYSAWLHVGDGAHTCDERETGNCEDPLHFHAWCRLPNPLQHREIRNHALAAKARRARQLRDPQTDAYEVLENELDAIARIGDSAKDDLVEELVRKEWWKDYSEAVADVNTEVVDDVGEDDEAEADETLVWEHIDVDKARLEELKAQAEKEPEIRDGDEYGELERRLIGYYEAIDKRLEELREPRRKTLGEKDISGLIDLARDLRIDVESNEEFTHTYSLWEWATCTRKTVRGAAIWTHPAEMTDSSEEVLVGLQSVYGDLERTKKEDASQGNS